MPSFESYKFPDARPWLLAAATPEFRAEAAAWAEWIPALLSVSDSEWNQRQRREAYEAYLAGRMARVPCGPPPAGKLSREVAAGWLAFAALDATARLQDSSWEEHIEPWARAMASMAGFKGSWRHPHIDAVCMALLLMARLDSLRLNSHSDEESASPDRTARQKVVWRECVQIRQYLADLLPIAEDLPRGAKGPFKYWWFSCL